MYLNAAFIVLVSGTIIAAIYVYIACQTVPTQCMKVILKVGKVKKEYLLALQGKGKLCLCHS